MKQYKKYFTEQDDLVQKVTPKDLVWALDQIQQEIVSDENKYFYAYEYLISLPNTKKLWSNKVFFDDLIGMVDNMSNWKGRTAEVAKNIIKQFVIQNR